MSWRMRVVHTTGYGYDGPVTSSFNEARLTPRSDGRQTVILSRVDTVPATRAHRYTDYWGSAVTAVVEPAEGVDPPTLDDLRDHARADLAGYKLPKHLVVVDRVQRSPAGKADYRWARAAAEDAVSP